MRKMWTVAWCLVVFGCGLRVGEEVVSSGPPEDNEYEYIKMALEDIVREMEAKQEEMSGWMDPLVESVEEQEMELEVARSELKEAKAKQKAGALTEEFDGEAIFLAMIVDMAEMRVEVVKKAVLGLRLQVNHLRKTLRRNQFWIECFEGEIYEMGMGEKKGGGL